LQILPAEHASVRVLDGDRARLLIGARGGAGKDHPALTFEPGRGIVGWVVTHGEVARVDDADSDPRFVAASSARQGFVIRSLLAAPLWSGDRVVAVLGVTSAERSAFSADHELVASLLANCAAPAIERARLQRLTITDPLTLAFNKRYLAPRLEQEMARAKRQRSELSILLMDLDHFKQVNDRYGHAIGDRVLRSFAERVRGLVRVSDVLLRNGGEEFLLLMPELSAEDALRAAERIRELMASSPISVAEDLELRQTLSIGVAVWDGQEHGAALESRADEAMYAAKRAGRDRVQLAP